MISSTSNPRIKALRLLQKAKERRDQGIFMIEGIKEIEKALLSGYDITAAYFCHDLISRERVENLLNDCKPEEVSLKVHNQLAYRENSGGLIVCARPKSTKLSDLDLPQNPLVLVLESIEKPGNLGALLRTADAAGVDAVIVCDQQTDINNPNVIRSSIGCVFTVPTVVSQTSTVIEWLKTNNIQILCAALTASKPHFLVDFSLPSAIIMGTESTGLTGDWLDQSEQNIIIPMHGAADSMNVSTSAAVIIFEAIRQRSV